MKKLLQDQREYMPQGVEEVPFIQIGAVAADGKHTLRSDRARYLVRQLRSVTDALGETPDLSDVRERIASAPETVAAVKAELQALYDALNGLEEGRRKEMQGVRDEIGRMLGIRREQRLADQPKPVASRKGPFSARELASLLDRSVPHVKRLIKGLGLVPVSRGEKNVNYYSVEDVARLEMALQGPVSLSEAKSRAVAAAG